MDAEQTQNQDGTEATPEEEGLSSGSKTEAPESKPEGGDAPEVEAKDEGEEGAAEEEKAEGTEEDDGDEAEKTDPGQAKKGRGQKNGWKRKNERQERELQAMRRELDELRAAQRQPASGEPPKEKTPDEKAAEYIEGLVEKRLHRREEEQRRARAQADFQRRMNEARAKHEDFDDVLASAEVPVSRDFGEALLTSEHAPAIMYQLAKSPEELARICALPRNLIEREIGRLEAKVSVAASPKPKPAARPPAPPTNVNGNASSTRSLENLSLADYKRAMRSGRRE